MTHLRLVCLNEGEVPLEQRGGGDRDVWAGAFRDYITTMRAAGRSPKTINLHRHYLHQLAKQNDDPWQVDAADILALMASKDWQAESRKSARTVYRSFYRWAVAADIIVNDPAENLPTVRVHRGVPRPTPEHIAQAVMHHADPRLALMAQLAGMCGLRAGEIAKVHASDYDPDSAHLTIHGKGNKERTVPIVSLELQGLLEQLPGWAFIGLSDGHLSAGHVSRLLSRAMPGHWSAHSLRHRAGTRAYLGTRDVLAVSRMLGHSRTETTLGYVQMDDAALVAAMTAAAA